MGERKSNEGVVQHRRGGRGSAENRGIGGGLWGRFRICDEGYGVMTEEMSCQLPVQSQPAQMETRGRGGKQEQQTNSSSVFNKNILKNLQTCSLPVSLINPYFHSVFILTSEFKDEDRESTLQQVQLHGNEKRERKKDKVEVIKRE